MLTPPPQEDPTETVSVVPEGFAQSQFPPVPVRAVAERVPRVPVVETVMLADEFVPPGPEIVIISGDGTGFPPLEKVRFAASAVSGQPTKTTAAKAKSSTTRFSLRTVFSPSWGYSDSQHSRSYQLMD